MTSRFKRQRGSSRETSRNASSRRPHDECSTATLYFMQHTTATIQAVKASKPKPAPAEAPGDVDDYLSAAFVVEKPNAARGRRQAEADPERGRVLSKKAIAKKMEERREEGLQQKIGEENAGFKLLMKLGYKGGGLGKGGAGSANPLMPELKQGRAGLGKDSEAKRRKEEEKERAKQQAIRDARREVERRAHFRLSKAAQFTDRQLQQDLSRVRRLVESLDESDGRPRSIMWPDEEDDAAEPTDDRVGEIDATAKTKTAQDEGFAKLSHREEANDSKRLDSREPSAEGLGADGGMREEWDMMTVEEKLSACLAYLRASHVYCMYCGCKYNGTQDLEESCPGPSRDDHDGDEL